MMTDWTHIQVAGRFFCIRWAKGGNHPELPHQGYYWWEENEPDGINITDACIGPFASEAEAIQNINTKVLN